jgi:hypothetical protein
MIINIFDEKLYFNIKIDRNTANKFFDKLAWLEIPPNNYEKKID